MFQRFVREISCNWKSGLTVALVSIPLSLSLAIASNAPPVMGIIASVWAGLFAAVFGGSEFNVIGPAGALSGILATFALTHGAGMLPIVAILSGIVIFVFFILRWDKYLVFIPSSVMHGFTLGVGLTIGLGQLNAAFGIQGLPMHEKMIENLMESLTHLASANVATAVLFFAMLGMLFALLKFFPRIPGTIIVAFVGMIIGYASHAHLIPVNVQTLLSKYGELKAILFQPPSFLFQWSDLALWKTVMTVSIVAVLETLLSAKIVDAMTNTRFDQRREMRGLALANIASGIAGGLPATGVLARTAINAKSGATSRFSSGLNAVFVVIIAFMLFGGFQYLPLAVVASILVFAAIRMIEAEHFYKLFRFDKSSFGLSILVAALTFGIDPMIGILVGATIALLQCVHHMSQGKSEVTLNKDHKIVARISHHRLSEFPVESDVAVYRIAGELTYFNGEAHEDALKHIKAKTLILNFRSLFYIDLDGMEMLKEMIDQQESAGQEVIITSVNDFIKPLLSQASWFIEKEKAGKIFSSTTEGLKSLGFPFVQ